MNWKKFLTTTLVSGILGGVGTVEALGMDPTLENLGAAIGVAILTNGIAAKVDTKKKGKKNAPKEGSKA